MNFKSIYTIGLLLLSTGAIKAQTKTNYTERIRLINQAVDQHLTDHSTGLYFETTDSSKNENKHSWLWPLCALVQAANEMETLQPGKHYMQPVEKAIEQYYSNVPPVPAYQDYVTKERLSSRFYDDNEWIAITYLDAYNRTHKKKYLDISKMIYRFIESGTDTVAGGGVYWKEGDHTTKNTCSNGPAILVALQLYKITKQKAYLDNALALYKWTNRYLQAPSGIYYDNVKVPSLKLAPAFYTYNTGTMLQSNALLYQITKNKTYLAEAQRIAKAGRDHFFRNGRLPGGEYWFNAVMLRGYEELYKIDRNKAWIDFYITDAEQIWDKERSADNLVSARPTKRLIDQAAMMEIYARLQRLTK
ncbi:glycoside hydrolase family 76 protein [Mucilaginibacter koreensis]